VPRTFAPLWLMGLTNAVYGMYGGIVVVSIPQLLSARHVPEATIASMTAAALSPGFWSFLVSPVLDVRFSRRWYAAVTAVAAAVLLWLAVLNLDNLALIETLLVAGFFCVNLNQSALGGWLSNITPAEQRNQLSVWVTIGNVGATGAMAMTAGEIVRDLSTPAAALVLGGLVLLPTAVYAWMPAPGPDRRLARESFPLFFGEILELVRRREVLLAILLFVAPAATFSLTNFLGGLGADFQVSPRLVGLVGGAGVMLGSISGCFLFRLIDRLLKLRFLYLMVGIIGSSFTLTLIPLPHNPTTFILALVGENVFQGLSITVSVAIAFETIGRDNPLAATTYSLMYSAFGIPISYMLFIDAWGYGRGGVAGCYAADAGLGLGSCLLLAALLRHATRPRQALGFDPPAATE
jgi:PAT family beta-lactamase induction signal transducer AmpG